MINWILCKLGWHTPNYKRDLEVDGIGRKHTSCKYCYAHIPLFSHRKIKKIFGEKRQKSFISMVEFGKGYIRYN